ncbi:TetR/AcrR family transcriptional regulator [Uniformispora flossi]|uniref:TetR/AcrR family transcriptional regulator n=1 Tax=Uniformispora flossi TaxID=3390723 RepID=UPI003C2B59D6
MTASDRIPEAPEGPAVGKRGRGRPRRRTEAEVLDAAAAVLAESGAAAVSIRKVADRLGTAPMTIYTSFPGRDALVDALATHLMSRHDTAPDAALPLDERVRDWMARYRDALVTTRLHELLAAGASVAPLLDVAARWTAQLATLGLSPADAAATTRQLVWAVHGFCAAEAGNLAAQTGRTADALLRVPEEHRAAAAAYLADLRAAPDFAAEFARTADAHARAIAAFAARHRIGG